jgi:hypothetical protein
MIMKGVWEALGFVVFSFVREWCRDSLMPVKMVFNSPENPGYDVRVLQACGMKNAGHFHIQSYASDTMMGLKPPYPQLR